MKKELESYRNQLNSNPDDAEALARLEAALLHAGDWEGLVALTSDRLKDVSDDDQRAGWLRVVVALETHGEDLAEAPVVSALALVAGRIRELRLGQLDEAMARYQRAFQLDEHNLLALERARSIYEQRGDWDLVLQLLDLELQASEDKDRQVDLYFSMAEVFLQLDVLSKAAFCVREAKMLAPSDARHAAFAERLSGVDEALETALIELTSRSDQTRDPRKRVALQVEAATLCFNVASSDERVELWLLAVLEKDPRNKPAQELVERFYELNERFADLERYLEGRIAVTARKKDRTGIFQRLAAVAATGLKDQDRAVHWHREVLKLDASEQTALNRCVEHYSATEQWLELVAVYEAALRARHRGGNEAGMLVQIAMTLWRKVGDLNAAESYFKRIKLNDPRNGVMLSFYTEFYESKGDWKRLLSTLSAQQNNEKKSGRKVAISLEMARVAEEELQNPAKAIDIWKGVLKLEPEHEIARDTLRRLFSATGKWNALLELVKEDLTRAAGEQIEAKVAILKQIIEIYRDHLHVAVMVTNTYTQILVVDPTNAEALDALEATYEREARWNDLVGVLKRRLETAPDDDASVALHRKIADLWLSKFSNPGQAIKSLEAILGMCPQDADAMARLVEIYQHRKDWKALYAVYQQQLPAMEGTARLDRLKEMAGIAASRLGNLDEAIALWSEVAAHAETPLEALEALDGLYQRAARWADLATLYQRRVDEADEGTKLNWLKKLGHVLTDQVEDEDAAAKVWGEVLDAHPGDLHAENFLREYALQRDDWDALSALYARREDWEGLLRLMSGAAESAEEMDAKVGLFRRMAGVCADKLNNEVAAVECWEQILEEDPEHAEAADVLAPYYRRVARWDDLVLVLEVQLGARLEADEPEALMRPLMIELAEVNERHRSDLPRAYSWYAQALELDTAHEGLLEETQRTAEASGCHEPFVDLLETLADVEEGAAEARLREVMAGICAADLGRADEAAAHYERARTLCGDTGRVLGALEALYRQLAQYDELLKVLQAQLVLAEGPEAEAHILASVGDVYESALEDPEAARETFERLLTVAPGNLNAIRGLQRLAESAGDDVALTAHLNTELAITEAVGVQAELLFRLGELAVRGEDLEGALTQFVSVLARDAAHAGALGALSSFLDGPLALEAALALEPHLRAGETWSTLRQVLSIQVERSDDPAQRAGLLREVAALYETRLSDEVAAFEGWQALLRETPDDASVREELARLAEALDAWAALSALYAEFAIDGPRSMDTETPALYGRLLAELLEARLSRPADALRCLLAVLEEEGDDLPTLDILGRLTMQLEDWRGLVDLYERRLVLTEDTEDQVEALFQMADLYEEMIEDIDGAVEVYRRVLAIKSLEAEAVGRLDRIFRAERRWLDLADLFELRLEGADDAARPALCFKLGQVLAESLNAPGDALERYAEVLEGAPEHEGAEEAIIALFEEVSGAEATTLRARGCDILAPIYEARKDWNRNVYLLQVRLEDEEVVSGRVALHGQIAELYERVGEDQVGAFAAYGAAFAEDCGNPIVLESLYRLAEAQGMWSALGELLRDALEDDDLSAERRPVLLAKTATLFEHRLGADEEAVAFNLVLLDETPEDADALARLDGLYARLDQPKRLVEVLSQRVELPQPEAERAALCFRMGELYEDRLDLPQEAIAVYARIRGEIAPDELRAHEALERLYEGAGAHEALVEVLLDHGSQLSALVERKACLYRAAFSLEEALARPEDAVEVYRQLTALDAADRRAWAALDRLYIVLEQPVELLEVLEAELGLAANDAERAGFWFRIGGLLADPLGELSRAVASFRTVLELLPLHRDARTALMVLFDAPEVRLEVAEIMVPIYEEEAEWLPLRDILRGALDEIEDPAERVAVLRRIAELEEQQLDTPDAAFKSLAEAFAASGGAVEIEAELERLVEGLGIYAELSALFGDVVMDAPERAVELRLKMAALAEGPLGDPAGAIREFREVLELEPEHSLSLDALERLYAGIDCFLDVIDILERKIEMAEDVAVRRALYARIADLQEIALERPEGAVETWRHVLDEEEANEAALENLVRLLTSAERWPELAALHEHRLGLLDDEFARIAIYFDLASVLEPHLGEGARALELHRTILALVPGHRGTYSALVTLFEDEARAEAAGIERLGLAEMLEPLLRIEEETEALVKVLEVRQEGLVDEPVTRAEVLREIAGLREAALGDPTGAFDACVRVLEIRADDEANRKDLRRLAGQTHGFDRLATGLEAAAADTNMPSLKVQLLMELARLEEQRGQDTQARAVYHDVLEVQPGHTGAIAALVELFTRLAAWEALVQLHLDLAESAAESEVQLSLYFKVCQLLEDVVDDAERAVEVYRKILEVEPDNAKAFRALRRFFVSAARWAELADLHRDEIDQAVTDGERAVLRFELGQVLLTRLVDVDGAISAWRAVIDDEAPDHEGCIEGLEDLLLALGEDDPRDPRRRLVAEILEGIYDRQARFNDWVMALEVQLEFQDDAWQQMEMLVRIAEAQEQKLTAPAAAFEAYARAFAVQYGNAELQVELDRLAALLGAWQPLVDAYLGGIEDFDDLDTAGEILLKVAGVLERELSDAEAAVTCYQRVLIIEESSEPALDALERLFSAAARHEDLVMVLGRKAEGTTDVLEKKDLLYRICEIWENILERPDQAISTYRRLFDEDPDDEGAVEALIRLFGVTAQWRRQIEVLHDKLEMVDDDEARVAILFRVAEVYETRLNDPEETIQTHRSVLELEPREARAVEALSRLFTQEQRWGELIDLLEGERDAALDDAPEQVTALEVRIANTLEHELGQVVQAIEVYGGLLARDPEMLVARAALERQLDVEDYRDAACRVLEPIYRLTGASAPLARVLELQLLELDEPTERVALHTRLAVLRYEALDDQRGAFASYGDAFEEGPEIPETLEALARLADELSMHAELATLLRAQVAAALDGQLAQALSRRLAVLLEIKLGRADEAAATWRTVVEADAYDTQALEALDRLYLDAQDWPGLIGVLRHRVDADGGADDMDLRFRLAYLIEVVENEVPQAVEAYRGILDDRPDHALSREALERLAVHLEYRAGIAEVLDPIYRDDAQWEKLAILIEMRVELGEDALARTERWLEVAELKAERLDDEAGALSCALRAFAETPTNEDARERVLDLGASQAEWQTLHQAFDAVQARLDDPGLLLEDQLRLAGWCRTELSDAARAVDHYRQALEVDDGCEPALEALEALYRDAESWRPLADILRRRVDGIFDLDEKRRRLMGLGALYLAQLDDGAAAVEAFEEVLDIETSDVEALTALETLHDAREDWTALADVFDRRLEVTESPDVLEATCRRLGALVRERLSDLPRATAAYEALLELAPESIDAIETLKALYTEAEDWGRLEEILVRQLGLESTPDARIPVLIALAENAELRLERPDTASEYYRQVLADTPDNLDVLGRLASLHEAAEAWFDLVEVLRSEAQVHREAQSDVLPVLVKIAGLAEEKLQDADLAIEVLNEVLAINADHAGALMVLARLYERSAEWQKAIETLDRAAKGAEAGAERARVWCRIGLLHLDHLDAPEAAVGPLEAAVEEAGDLEAIQALLRAARTRDDDAAVMRWLVRALEGATSAERPQMWIELAALRLKTGDVPGQIEALQAAVEGAPEDLDAADMLLEAYFAADRHQEAEPLLKATIERLKAARRHKDLLRYNFRMGCVAEARGDDEVALEAFAACFSYDATYVPNLLRLGALHFKLEDWPAALKVFQTILLHQGKLDLEEKVDLFYRLGRVRQGLSALHGVDGEEKKALSEGRKAKDMFNRALGLNPGHGPSKDARDALESAR